ncbi:hypothetical protein V8G54_000664 [Vigna mungo]|uniref:Chromo domain-containing protein n=1 Tax=Vigna mungo TaxID=3915 RepID=A0AAQ3P6V6_VIGMU
MSTSYHPKTDGQNEVINYILDKYLRSFVHAQPCYLGLYISLVGLYICPIAYKLDFPPNSRIHPMFHYSFLKLHKRQLPSVSTELPPLTQDNKPIIEPLAILDTKMDVSTVPPTKLAVVQWKGLAPKDTTWEI